jgi:uncharacterized protein YprB with RNaseH-like and TPR domain
MSLKSKLNRMKKHLGSDDKQVEIKVENKDIHEKIPYLEDWLAFDAKPFYYDGEYIFIREKEYPLSTKHGLYELGALQGVVNTWNSSCLNHPLSVAGLSSSDLFFFDTETTGLGGGTGTTIFLLGYARVFQDKVVVKQLFLPSPASEVALYHYFLTEVDYTTLVTYNGKAFDWPQVKTRYTLIRDLLPKLPQFGHFDLLHASRRLWKSEYESLKLSIVEKEILQIHRDSDTPGFMAPMIYFHYLDDKNPEGVFGIMKHNETDILTLISLYVHISNKLLFKEEGSTNERYEVARWLDSIGERQAAMDGFHDLTSIEGEKNWEAKSALATLCKKENNLKKAVKLWEELQEEEQVSLRARIQAAIELAKFYEHNQQEITVALDYANMAQALWKNGPALRLKEERKWHLEFEKRIQRLERKVRNIK